MTIDTVFWVFYWSVMANVVLGLPTLLLLSYKLPATLRSRYYREPYFREQEVALLTRFPLSIFNDVALASMFVWPRLGEKRGVVGVGDELSGVYQCVLRLYFWGTSSSLVLALAAGAWLWLH
jgi:hypothetical protein